MNRTSHRSTAIATAPATKNTPYVGTHYIDVWDHKGPRPSWVWSTEVDDVTFVNQQEELEPGERAERLRYYAWQRRQLAQA